MAPPSDTPQEDSPPNPENGFASGAAGKARHEPGTSAHGGRVSQGSIGLDALADPSQARLTIQGELAEGGMGIVLRVRDEVLRRDLAMKKVKGGVLGIDKTGSTSLGTFNTLPRLIRRLLDEAQITAQLDHSGVVPVHELGVDKEGEVYFTMKRVRGVTLGDVLREHRMGSAEWPLPRLLRILLQVCETLAYAHAKGVIHRDVKPSNIMVGRFGEVYVMDWGLAKVLGSDASDDLFESTARKNHASQVVTDQSAAEQRGDEAGITMHGDVVGTLGYMAPEQATGGVDAVDERSDVYSAGCLLYQVLAGHAPYFEPDGTRNTIEVLRRLMDGPPAPLSHVAPDAPAELAAITERALAHDPAERFPNILALAQDLRAFLEGRVVQSYRTGVWIELRKWVARNRALAAAACLGVLVVVGGVVGYGILQKRSATAIAKERDAANESATLAEIARREAEGVRLATQAQLIVEEQPNVALALALEAHDRAPGPESKSALLAALVQHREVATLYGASSYARRIRFIKAGRELVCMDRAGGITVWDVATHKPTRFIEPRMRAAMQGPISRDGRWALISSDTDVPHLVNIETGERTILQDKRLISVRARFNRDATRLLTIARDGEVAVRELPSGEVVKVLLPAGGLTFMSTEHDDVSVLILETPSLKRLVAYDFEADRILWTRDDIEGHASVNHMRFTNDGTSFLTEYTGNFQVAWRKTEDGTRLKDLKVDGRPAYTAVPIPQSDDVYVSFHSSVPDLYGQARLSLKTGVIKWHNLGHGPFGPGQMNRAGTALAMLGPTAAGVIDLRTGALMSSLGGHRYSLSDIAFSPGGDLVATASHDRTVKLWRLGPKGEHLVLADAVGEERTVAALSQDAEIAVVRAKTLKPGAPHTYAVMDAATGATTATFTTGGPITYGPVVDRANGTVWWFEAPVVFCRAELETGTSLSRAEIDWPEGLAQPRGRLLSPDGKTVALIPATRGVYLHDATTGERTGHVGASTEYINHMQWLPGSDGLVLAHAPLGYFSVVDVSSGDVRYELRGHSGHIIEYRVTSDGRVMYSTAVDSSLRVWDLDAGTEANRIVGLPMKANNFVMSPEGTHLLVNTSYRLELFEINGLAQPVLQAQLKCGWRPQVGFTADGSEFWHHSGGGRLMFHPLNVVATAEEVLTEPLSEFDLRRFSLGNEREQEAARVRAQQVGTLEARVSLLSTLLSEGKLEQAEMLIEQLHTIRPTWGLLFLARARLALRRAETATGASRAAQITKAFAALEQGLQNGLQYSIRGYRWKSLPDLEPLHEDPRWEVLTSDLGR